MDNTKTNTKQKPEKNNHLLTHEEICNTIKEIADEFSLTKVLYFGSYANGKATEKSDLDLLVEFTEENVSILRIIKMKHTLEEILKIPVDVIHAPIPKDSYLEIEKTVVAYENI